MEEYSKKLVEYLVERGQLNRKKAQDVLLAAESSQEAAEKTLVAAGYLEKEPILNAKSALFKIPSVDVAAETIDMAVANILPQAMSQRYHAVCLGRSGDKIKVAMEDPTDGFATNYIKMRTGLELDLYTAYAGDIEDAQEKIYGAAAPSDSSAPAGLRERIGQEVVRARTMHVATRIKTQPQSTLDMLVEKTKAPRAIRLDGVPPASPENRPAGGTLSPQRVVQSGGTLPQRHTEGSQFRGRAVPLANDRRGNFMEQLAHVSLDLVSALDDDSIVDRILEKAGAMFEAEAVSLLLVDWEHSQLFFRKARGPVKDDIVNLTLPLEDSSVAGWVVTHRQPANIKDASSDERHYHRLDRDLRFKTRNLMAAPIMHGDQVLGVLEVINKHEGDFDDDEVESLQILAAHTSVALHNAMGMQQLHNFYHQAIEILIDCYQAFDPEGREHVVSVARLATAMGNEMRLSAQDMETLAYASLLHDIGKIRSAPEDPRHAVLGAQLLSHVTLFSRIVPVVRGHHEKWAGGGTPDGLSGEQIPLLARVLALAESYHEEGGASNREAFMARFGTDFDPSLREPFERALAAG
jgi:putative nucleotidyltransferase with HDIG domain